MYAAKTRWRKAPTKYMVLEITNTDRLIINYLETILQRKAQLKNRRKEWGDNPERNKPCWRIIIHNRKAAIILKAVLPYMKGEKKARAEEALAEYEERELPLLGGLGL